MIKYLSFLIFKLIILIDGFLFLLFKKNIKYKIYDFLRECAYIEEKILDKKVIFFAPSSNSRERVKKLLTKEPDTINWIKNFNKFEIDKPIFWDIGSNIGLFSIFASVCHENLKVISFEPSTNNLALLSRNISINKLSDKISINQFPLSDKKNKYLKLKESNFIEGGALNTFGEEYDYEGNKFEGKNNYNLYGTTIDYLIEEKILEIPNFIKIDVDGIEHLILNGANKLLMEKNLKSIQIELNENFEFQFNECNKILSAAGFVLKSKNLASSRRNKSPRFSKMFNCVFERN